MPNTQAAPRLADVDPLTFTTRARAGQVLAAVALDVAMPVALLVTGVIVVIFGPATVGWVLVAVALALLFVAGWLLGRSGRTLGAATVDARIVHRADGVAAGRRALPALFTGALGMFDLKRGRDPFAPAIAEFQFPDAAPRASAPTGATRGLVPTLHLDSGERLSLDTALVLGRDPAPPRDAPAEVYRWADMSRTLSKSHVQLEWDGYQVWVTDLGSTNGPFVRGAGSPTPLLAHQRTPIPTDVTLEIGDRVLTVREAA